MQDNIDEESLCIDKSRNEIITAKILGGERISIARKNLVGYCHYSLHPGKLTEKVMEKHNCVEKQCCYLEKYKDSSYWRGQLQKQMLKEIAKEKLQTKKDMERAKQEHFAELREVFQAYADGAGYKMLIVRVEKPDKRTYKVFYVSENRFCDGNQFPEVIKSAKFLYPKHRIFLWHIRDVDRHFVTVDEYVNRKK